MARYSKKLVTGGQLGSSEKLWANQGLIGSICRVAEERIYG